MHSISPAFADLGVEHTCRHNADGNLCTRIISNCVLLPCQYNGDTYTLSSAKGSLVSKCLHRLKSVLVVEHARVFTHENICPLDLLSVHSYPYSFSSVRCRNRHPASRWRGPMPQQAPWGMRAAMTTAFCVVRGIVRSRDSDTLLGVERLGDDDTIKFGLVISSFERLQRE